MRAPALSRTVLAAGILLAVGAGVALAARRHPAAEPAALGLVPAGARVDGFAAVQYDGGGGGAAENRGRLAELAAGAARGGARYVVLPEHAVEGPPGAAGVARPEPPGGPTARFFAEVARRERVWLAVPVNEAAEGGGYSVTALLLDPRGAVRARLPKRVLRPNGDDGPARVGFARILLDSYDDGGRRFGVLSGDDLEAGVPRLATRGADVILVSANWSPDDAVDWRAAALRLAAEFRVHLVVANRRPELGGIFSPGGRVVRPKGAVAAAPLPAAGRGWRVASSPGLPSVPIPAQQPFSPTLVELGRRLFLDPGLSETGTVSCATCHVPEKAFADGRARGEGVRGRETRRNVPTLLNAAFRPTLHWDGNPTTIEQQFKYPLVGFAELNRRSHEDLLVYVRSRPAYVRAFRRGMGVEPGRIGREEVAQALAAYQRTLVSGGSAFDEYRYGGRREALGPAALRGLALFTGKAGCAGCHTVDDDHALFSDGRFHRLGIGYSREGRGYSDPGVGTVSDEDYAGMFFTPPLRNVAETAPYMHDGSVPTLEGAVRAHYLHPEREPALRREPPSPAETAELVAFLRSLTGRERYTARGERAPAHTRANTPRSPTP